MRRLVWVAVGLFVAVFAAAPAYAATPDVDDIVAALQESSVYVAEGATGTNSDTAAMLEAQLYESDHIAIVMLPSDGISSSQEADALAGQISDALNNEDIVAVAAGDFYGADGDILPAGTADELMNRANAVSQTSIDTVNTFIRNVHDWVRANPQQVEVPEAVAAAGPDLTWIWFVALGLLVIPGTIIALTVARRRTHAAVKYTAPGGLNDPIRQLMNLGKRIPERDGRMAEAINDVCRHTEAYFTRLSPQKRRDDAAIRAFEINLVRIREIVDVYIDTLKNREYFDDPKETQTEALEAVQVFAESVKTSIKRNNRQAMLDFRVNSQILTAQRYK